MRVSRAAVSVTALVLVGGCGAILHGPRQLINVQSSPSGARVETAPAAGTFTTPTALNLERKNSYVLTFTSPGYNPATFNLQNGIGTGTVIADVLLTGLVGVLVDGMTGSWYGLSPESANVTLVRAAGNSNGPAEIHIELKESGGGQHVELTSDAPGVAVSVRKK